MSTLAALASFVADMFEASFECRGQSFGRFGSPSIGWMGVHDGCSGVQWNAWYSWPERTAWLGVNLEGMKYDGWPVARLIKRELSRPLLLTQYRSSVDRPGEVRVSWRRDAWQGSGRVKIREAELSPTPIQFDKLEPEGWTRALIQAKECLDPRRNHRGRRRTRVTLSPSGETVMKYVTPHLQFMTQFDCFAANPSKALKEAKANLDPLHEFASRRAVRRRG